MVDIKGNLVRIKHDIKNHALVGYENVKLIAVTKTVEIPQIEEAISYGITDIGENKAQEFKFKYQLLQEKARVHFIGNLQTNKVKDVIDKAWLIHSLDRISLLTELEKRASQKRIPVNALIQVNISKEISKSGVYVEDLDSFIESISSMDYIKIKGLMTMAPDTEDESVIRNVFRSAKFLFDNLKKETYKNIEMVYLSMGMSNDYKIALEEGANMIRIGSSIFK